MKIVVGALAIVVVGCAVTSFAGQNRNQFVGVPSPDERPGATELVASLEFHPSQIVDNPPLPFVKVFSDGTVVYGVRQPAKGPELVTGKLRPEELVTLRRQLDEFSELSSSKERVMVTPATDQPSTVVGLRIGQTWKVVTAYGFDPTGPTAAESFATRLGAPTTLEQLPEAFMGLVGLLSKLRVSNTVHWQELSH